MRHPIISVLNSLLAALIAPLFGATVTWFTWWIVSDQRMPTEALATILSASVITGAIFGIPIMLLFGTPIYYALQKRRTSFFWTFCTLGTLVGLIASILITAPFRQSLGAPEDIALLGALVGFLSAAAFYLAQRMLQIYKT